MHVSMFKSDGGRLEVSAIRTKTKAPYTKFYMSVLINVDGGSFVINFENADEFEQFCKSHNINIEEY